MRTKSDLQAAIRQRRLATGDLWLRTEPPLPLDIDGEIHGETPARITLAPNALRVVVDPGFPDT